MKKQPKNEHLTFPIRKAENVLMKLSLLHGIMYFPLIAILLLLINGMVYAGLPSHVCDSVILSHDQYMATYDGANNNDVVGLFDPWYCTQDTTSETFYYVFTNSKGGIYAIHYTTGLVTINNNTNLASGIDTLTVEVTLGSVSREYHIYVTVREESDCYFIDPSAGTNGSGTRTSPYNTWSGVSFSTGKAYFQKRGTSYTSN
jgi:hypothetical protein